MSAADVLGSVSNTAEALADRIDTERVAAVVSDVAIGDLIAAAAPSVDAASEQIARTARVGWQWRRQMVIAIAIGVTLGVALTLIRRRRSEPEVPASEAE